MKKLRTILAYAEWIVLFGLIVTFGVLIYPIKAWAAIITFACAALFLYIMFEQSSKTFSPANRIGGGKPLGSPLVDIGLITVCMAGFTELPDWSPLFTVALVNCGIDLALIVVNFFITVSERRQSE